MSTLNEDIFDDLMAAIGNHGKFQKRFNFLFNFVFLIFILPPYWNIAFFMAIPDHWCKVPGRELSTFTTEEWKLLTIPKVTDSKGTETFSKCSMYNISLDNINKTLPELKGNFSIVSCQFGWEYDNQWYQSTVPSQQNWVCRDELKVANIFMTAKISEVLGAFVLGQFGDFFGRKPLFFVSLIIAILGRCMSVMTSHNFVLFLLSVLIGNLASCCHMAAVIIIGIEISRNQDRALIYMLQCFGWTLGMCILPMTMWIAGRWVPFVLITTLPCVIFLFSKNLMIESPRWLVGRKKVSRCVDELNKIAKVNGKKMPDNAPIQLQQLARRTEKIYGVLSLFSSWRLAKNTILLITGWIVIFFHYFILLLNFGNYGSNPFLNFFLQSLVELPGIVVAKYICNHYGRRWSNIIGFTGTAIGCVFLIFTITHEDYDILVVALSVFWKFTVTIAYFTIQLQTVEIYPTCLRQTGASIGTILANAFGIFAPYLIYLGTSIDAKVPYIVLAAFTTLGIVTGIFLPETLNMKLAETLKDAHAFGADQKLWSVSKK